YEIARDLVRNIGQRDPLVGLTVKKSTIVRATTDDTAKRLYKIGASDVEIVPEVGLLNEEIETLKSCELPVSEPVRFISMGRLLHWKGFHLGIRGFAKANLSNAEYWVIGDGPELANLKRIAQSYGVEKQVKFWGRLPREETLDKLAESHVLVHPSLHDSGGWVCIEAMASGRPVICLDLGGPSIQVTDKTGFKVQAHNPEQATEDIAKAMVNLAGNSQLRVSMGRSGQQLVDENYSWDVIGKRLNSIYQTLAHSKVAV
ncbi:MAG: glycosyltransferase family 4 protein, partial [Leptolyngbya sp. SIO3F4]|nr:glycosyltransferase family 4 protein [Leptolyngbya sp. SIO3F4]